MVYKTLTKTPEEYCVGNTYGLAILNVISVNTIISILEP